MSSYPKKIFLSYFQKIILVSNFVIVGVLLPQLFGGQINNANATTFSTPLLMRENAPGDSNLVKLKKINDVYYLTYKPSSEPLKIATSSDMSGWSAFSTVVTGIGGNYDFGYYDNGNFFYTVFSNESKTEIFITTSTDAITWSATSTIIADVNTDNKPIYLSAPDANNFLALGYVTFDSVAEEISFLFATSSNGIVWSTSTIANNIFTPQGFVVDGNIFHALYDVFSDTNFDTSTEVYLEYAKSTDAGATWVTTTIGRTDYQFYFPENMSTLELDNNGNPGIVYYRVDEIDENFVWVEDPEDGWIWSDDGNVTTSVRYAKYSGSSWASSTVSTFSLPMAESTGGLEIKPSLTFSENNEAIFAGAGPNYYPYLITNTNTLDISQFALTEIDTKGTDWSYNNGFPGLSLVFDTSTLSVGFAFVGADPVLSTDRDLFFTTSTVVVAPSTPTGLTATPSTSTQIDLTWDSVSGATSYILYSATTSAFTVTNTVTSTVNTSYSNTGLTASTTYYYKVSAVGVGGESSKSTAVSTTTLALANSVPTASAIYPVFATDGTGFVTVTTTIVDADSDWVELFVDYSLDGGSTWASSTLGTVSGDMSPITSTGKISSIGSTVDGNSLTFTWNSLVDAGAIVTTTAKLRITPNDGTANGSIQTSANFTVDNLAPSAPTTIILSPTAEGTIITWSDVVGASTYTVSTTAGTATTTSATTTEYTGLTPNTSYTFQVKATDAYGNVGSYSSVSSTYTLASTPTAPTVTAVSSTILNIIVADDGATTYAVKIVTGVTTKYLQADGTIGDSAVWLTYSQLGGGSATSTVGLSANISYTVSVAGKNGNDVVTAYTSASAVYTLANQASAPTPCTPATSTIPLTINVNSNPVVTTYAIYNYTDSNYLDSAGTVTTTAVYQTTSTWDAISAIGLTPNTSYQFQVIARNGDDINATTSPASTATTTNPNTPISVVGTANGQTSVIVSWSDNSNSADTLYQVYNYTDSEAEGTTTSTSYTVTGLTAGTSYEFNVRAQYQSDDTTYTDYSATSTAVLTATVASTVTVILNTGASSTFQLSAGGASHTATLDSIASGVATVTVASTPFTVSLSAGQSSNNAANGITVTMNSVGASSASFSLSSYTAPVVSTGGGGGGISTPQKPVLTSFTINNGAKITNSRVVTLNFNASNVSLMLLSNSNYFNSNPYLAYQSTWTWTLEPSNGLKTIYARLRSNDGGEILINQSITLDEKVTSNQVIDNTVSTEPQITPPLTSPTVYQFITDLKIGSTGEAVKQLQIKLKVLGYFTYPSITSYYGAITANAVKKLQAVGNLKTTGIVDSPVRNILNSAQSVEEMSVQPVTNLTQYTFTKLLSYGMRGEDIKQLQIRLQELGYLDKTITPILNFGPATRAAVIKLQKAHNLTPALGYTGPGTRGVLNGVESF